MERIEPASFRVRYRSVHCGLLIFLLIGCNHDHGGRQVQSPRVISFSPALTQILNDLGLDNHIAGVTKYCKLPEGLTIPVVGDTLNIRVEPILSVHPDIILTQTKSREFESVLKMRPEIQIEHFQIETLGDIGLAMERLGNILGEGDTGKSAKDDFEKRLERIKMHTSNDHPRKVLFVLGYDHPRGQVGIHF